MDMSPFLHLFAACLRDDLRQLPDLLVTKDVGDLLCWVHRQAGALATMGYMGLVDHALNLTNALSTAPADETYTQIEQFGHSLAQLIENRQTH